MVHTTSRGDGDRHPQLSAAEETPTDGENRDEANVGESTSEFLRPRLQVTDVPVDECLRGLQEQDAALSRQIVRTSEIVFPEDGGLIVGGNRLRIGDAGLDRVGRRFGAPVAYLSRLPADLLARLLDHDLRATFPPQQELQVISRDGSLEMLGENSLFSLTTTEVLTGVVESIRPLAGDLQVRSQGDECIAGAAWIDGSSVRVQLLSINQRPDQADPGDVVAAGLQIRHSPLGVHATTIEGFFDRLRCRNGLVHRECVGGEGSSRTRRQPVNQPNAHRLQMDQVRRLAVREWNALTERLSDIQGLSENRHDTEIENVPALFARWLEQARLSTRHVGPRLHAAWRFEGARPTVWGAVNAFTEVGTHHVDLPHRTRRLLSGLGGILAFHRNLCRACFARLTGSAAATAA